MLQPMDYLDDILASQHRHEEETAAAYYASEVLEALGYTREEGLEALQRAAHQLKGAAGSYGFDQLTPYALHLETLLKHGAEGSEIARALGQLAACCRRVTAAVPNKHG